MSSTPQVFGYRNIFVAFPLFSKNPVPSPINFDYFCVLLYNVNIYILEITCVCYFLSTPSLLFTAVTGILYRVYQYLSFYIQSNFFEPKSVGTWRKIRHTFNIGRGATLCFDSMIITTFDNPMPVSSISCFVKIAQTLNIKITSI